MQQIHDGMWNTGAPLHNLAALLKVRALAPCIIRIMPQIHDRMWNTDAPHHNHAALLKVKVLAPSSGLCFKGTQA
jgi:hypothetical protein